MLPGPLKQCRTCGLCKVREAFGRNKNSSDGYKHECVDCSTERSKQQRKNNPGKSAEYSKDYRQRNPGAHRDYHLRTTFGISLEQYEFLSHAQGEVCGVCRKPSTINLAVDHDHNCCPSKKSCGKCIRALLCGNCNRALGLVREDPDILWALLTYIEKPELRMGLALK